MRILERRGKFYAREGFTVAVPGSDLDIIKVEPPKECGYRGLISPNIMLGRGLLEFGVLLVMNKSRYAQGLYK